MTIIASSPGSMMLMGEHAVLHGHMALVAAVDARVVVSVQPRNDRQVFVDCVYGQFQTNLDALSAEAPFDLVITVLAAFAEQLEYGCSIHIDSSAMPTAMGIGSSTALAVALTAAMQYWLKGECQSDACFSQALQIIRQYQGSCSGADVAASVYGGVLAYGNAPQQVQALSWLPDAVVLYSGFKMKTADVIMNINQRFSGRTDALLSLYQRIGACVQKAIAQLSDQETVERAIAENQRLMHKLGVVDERLQGVLDYLQQQSTIRLAKVSGAGLGDCVIGFGRLTSAQQTCPYEVVPVQFSHKGVEVEQR